jgi:hypothetical protein
VALPCLVQAGEPAQPKVCVTVVIDDDILTHLC